MTPSSATRLRKDGKRVWSITWNDVQAFVSDTMKVAVPDLVHQQVQNTASEFVEDQRLKTLWQNPIDMLVEYLSDPQAEVWSRGSFATVLGLVNPPGKHGTGPPVQVNPAHLDAVTPVLASRVRSRRLRRVARWWWCPA